MESSPAHLDQIILSGRGAEEHKELFFRKDPTFHNESMVTVYSGGSIENILFLKNS